MSVVNQMLRDLDRRQENEGSAVYTQHLRPVGAHGRKPLLLIGAAFLVAAGGTYAALQYFNRTAPAQPAATAAPVISSAITPAMPAAPASAAEPDAQAGSNAAPAEPQVEKTDSSVAVADESQVDSDSNASAPSPGPSMAARTPVTNEPAAPVRESATRDSAPIAQAPARPAEIAPPSVPTTRIVSGDRPVTDPGATKIDVRPHAPAARTADSEFHRAAMLINQARSQEARDALKAALELDARHEGARQTLAVLLIEARALDEAETVLTEGLRINPTQANFAIVLARLKLDRGNDAGALQTLREHGGAAAGNAEYRGFVAALLQRMNRPAEAIDEYRAALTLSPNVAVWWVGLGMSYEAAERTREATEAYVRASAIGTLSADVAQFVERKLQTLR